MQAALNFCLGAVAMDTKRFAAESFKLMAQIFRHHHFQAVMNVSTPNPSASPATLPATSSGATKSAAPKSALSFADIVKTSAPAGARASLTASRTAKTLNRLTEAVTLFTRQDGYNVIIEALENAEILGTSTVSYFRILSSFCSLTRCCVMQISKPSLPSWMLFLP